MDRRYLSSVEHSLDGYLSGEKSAGKHDSEGHFTLATDQAIRKLGASQLPRGSAWLLKVVQSAVVMGAEKLTFRQTSQTTFCEYSSEQPFDIGAVERALTADTVTAGRAIRHLAVGLRAVGFGDNRSFALVVDQNGSRHELRWDGKKLSRRTSSLETKEGSQLCLMVRFPETDRGRRLGGLARGAGRAGTEYLELVSNAEVCPIPLLFDGRRLDNLGATRKFASKPQEAYLSLAWPRLDQQGPSLPLLRIPQALSDARARPALTASGEFSVRDRFDDGRVFAQEVDSEQTEAEVFLKIRYLFKVKYGRESGALEIEAVKEPSRCHWVCDGVISQTDPRPAVKSALCFDLYLSAHHMETDLSGLSLIKTSEMDRRANQGWQHVPGQCQAIAYLLTEHRPGAFKEHTQAFTGLGTVFAAAAFLGPAGVLGFVGAMFMGAIAMKLSARNKAEVVIDCIQRLQTVAGRPREELGLR